MRGIKIGDKHTADDWGLIQTSKLISIPVPKTNYQDIEGYDGSIDLSEIYGDIKYNDRIISCEYDVTQCQKTWSALTTDIINYCHGKKFKIVDDDDKDYYYIGRVSINEFKNDRRVGKLVIEGKLEPYKYKKEKTILNINFQNSETKRIILKNGRKSVVPKIITTSKNTTIIFNNNSTVLKDIGIYQILDLQLTYGENELKITSDGPITIEYQEGDL